MSIEDRLEVNALQRSAMYLNRINLTRVCRILLLNSRFIGLPKYFLKLHETASTGSGENRD